MNKSIRTAEISKDIFPLPPNCESGSYLFTMISTLFARADLTNPDGSTVLSRHPANGLAPWNYYGYYPNLAAAIIMCVAFAVAFAIGLFNRIRHRKQIKGRFLT